jgi:hypothetical protein
MNTDVKIRLAKKNGIVDSMYPKLVEEAIREKYSLSDELAILRQRDSKPEEFEEYNTFVEQCKADIKAKFSE